MDLVLPPVSVAPDESLSDALPKFLETGYGRIPIEDNEAGVIGMPGLEDLLARYQPGIAKAEMKTSTLYDYRPVI